MKLRTVFAANAAFHFLSGAIFIGAPAELLSLFAVTLAPEPLEGARLLGVGLCGVGLLEWSLRASEASSTTRAIAHGLMMINGVGCAVFLEATLQGSLNPLGWTLVALCALRSGLYRAALLRGA